ncbi:type II secretion system protein [bacterium]|nr:type II secretion system protein [bacterium]
MDLIKSDRGKCNSLALWERESEGQESGQSGLPRDHSDRGMSLRGAQRRSNPLQILRGIAIATGVNKTNLKVHTFTLHHSDSNVIASTNDSECVAIQKNSYRNDWIASSDLHPPRNDGWFNKRKELIHLITYSPIPFKKAGFTLAEVLITIGIIGVVSALTIPGLYTKIQHKILVEQFKKAYASANQALKLVQEENEKEFLCYSDGWGSYKQSECAEFWGKFFAIQKTPKPCNGGKCGVKYKNQTQVLSEGGSVPNPHCSLNADLINAYVLPNGVIYHLTSGGIFFSLDINGNAGPNRWGYDVFYLTWIKDNSNESAPLMLGEKTCSITEKGGYTFEQMLKEIKK